MPDPSEKPEKERSATISFNTRPSPSPLRNRRTAMSSRNTDSPGPGAGIRRRGSMMSIGSESVGSIKTTTDDLFLPRVSRSGLHQESSHFHSVPLFLAIVPAIAGLFYQNGSAIVTDLTLLGLAAILLNWSIRLPWDWYGSAQALRVQDSLTTEDFLPRPADPDTIVEEESADEAIDDEDDSKPPAKQPASSKKGDPTPEQLSAASSLRIHESMALAACFIGPIAGAALLHTIRGQLSRPSEGLVSNYNLTIFLLASELRPLSHLIKLIQNRTLHLQRVVASNPHSPSSGEGSSHHSSVSNEALAALAERIASLESGLKPSQSGPSSSASTTTGPNTALAEVRRSLQPDIDALNRAVRRYEKRATLLAMQVDGRITSLEARVQDTLALAAAAERNASSAVGRKGSATVLADWAAACVVIPVQAALWTFKKGVEIPGRLLGAGVRQGREAVLAVAAGVLPYKWQQGPLSARKIGDEGMGKGKVKVRERMKEKPGKKAS